MKNQPVAGTIILSASYSYEEKDGRRLSTAEVDEMTKAESDKYMRRYGRAVTKLKRVQRGDREDLKFLYFLGGATILDFGLINASHTSARRIVVPGSPQVGARVEEFITEFPDARARFVYVPDGNGRPSLSKTLKTAYGALKPNLEKNELTLFLPADVPLLTNLESVLQDPSITRNNLVVDFNVQQNLLPTKELRDLWSKTFHHTFLVDGKGVQIKEPNPYLINLNHIAKENMWWIFDVFYGSRKAGGVSAKTLLSASMHHPFNFISILGNLALEIYHIRNKSASFERLQRVANWMFNTSVKLRLDHPDPHRVNDIDSYQDHELYEILLTYHPEIYPYQSDLERLKRIGMKNSSLSPLFINEGRARFGISPLYDAQGKVIRTPERKDRADRAYEFLKGRDKR